MTAPDKIKEKHTSHQVLSTKTGTRKQKNIFKKIILGFILALGLVIYYLIAYKSTWLSAINSLEPFSYNKNKSVENNIIKQEASSKVTDKNTEAKAGMNGCFPENSEQLLKFAPDKEELDLINDEENLSPYDKEVTESINDNTQVMSSVNLINDLNDYRIYLANVSEFLYKFSKDQPYSKNLDIIMQIQLPKEFEEMMEMCKHYNIMLLESASPYEKILLFNTNIFDKFLKIKKETDSYKEMKRLKAKIENKIDLFINYAFSLNLQEEFLGVTF